MLPEPIATILLVEDEPLIRMATAVELEGAGFQVLQASDADEAIGMLEREPSIRVIVTDIDMPGDRDGVRLAHTVRHRWPPVHIVVISGRRAPQASDLPEKAVFFAKPCRVTDLNRTLRSFGV